MERQSGEMPWYRYENKEAGNRDVYVLNAVRNDKKEFRNAQNLVDELIKNLYQGAILKSYSAVGIEGGYALKINGHDCCLIYSNMGKNPKTETPVVLIIGVITNKPSTSKNRERLNSRKSTIEAFRQTVMLAPVCRETHGGDKSKKVADEKRRRQKS